MTIDKVFRALFPNHDYPGDDRALAELQAEVEVLREQIAMRRDDMMRTYREFLRNKNVPLAELVFLSRDLVEQSRLAEGRAAHPAPRSFTEIQRAHDVLIEIIEKKDIQRIAKYDAENLNLMSAAADVLCWMLCHNHNQTFARNLADIEAHMFACGFMFLDRGCDNEGI